ncbi:MFS_MosC_like domain containing protein [Candidatus Nanopelagicaceae bacterium]
MAKKDQIEHAHEEKLIRYLFFLFGFGVMAWVPRMPEVKENLGLENGAFGSLLSSGSLGALFGLLSVGHVIHKIGVKKVLISSILLLFGSLAMLVHITSSFTFLVLNIAFGFGITAMHVAINSQAFHYQERSGANIVTRAHGVWSAGALLTAIISGALVGHVSLATHIDVLAFGCAIAMLMIVSQLHPALLPANENDDDSYSIKQIFTSFKVDWPITLGLACASYLEFAVGDWGTIFTKERLGIDSGLSTVPYILFTAAMIFGRFMIHRLTDKYEIDGLVKKSALLAGLSFGSCIIIATHLPASMKWWSYGLFVLGFLMAGLGLSFLGPTFFAIANRRSTQPSAVVIGQLGVANNILMFICKWLVAWTIQFTGSIALAFMIPTAMVIATVFFTRALRPEERKN